MNGGLTRTIRSGVRRSAMRRCLKGRGRFPLSNDGFILGPSHGQVGRLYSYCSGGAFGCYTGGY